jgi:hypothetical protein
MRPRHLPIPLQTRGRVNLGIDREGGEQAASATAPSATRTMAEPRTTRIARTSSERRPGWGRRSVLAALVAAAVEIETRTPGIRRRARRGGRRSGLVEARWRRSGSASGTSAAGRAGMAAPRRSPPRRRRSGRCDRENRRPGCVAVEPLVGDSCLAAAGSTAFRRRISPLPNLSLFTCIFLDMTLTLAIGASVSRPQARKEAT